MAEGDISKCKYRSRWQDNCLLGPTTAGTFLFRPNMWPYGMIARAVSASQAAATTKHKTSASMLPSLTAPHLSLSLDHCPSPDRFLASLLPPFRA